MVQVVMPSGERDNLQKGLNLQVRLNLIAELKSLYFVVAFSISLFFCCFVFLTLLNKPKAGQGNLPDNNVQF